ncbi:unnamed protein product [Penicillium discolor]
MCLRVSRVEEPHPAHVRAKLLELGGVVITVGESLAELVEEHRPDDLHDVGLGRVVLAELTPCGLVLDGLEEAAEDRRRDR